MDKCPLDVVDFGDEAVQGGQGLVSEKPHAVALRLVVEERPVLLEDIYLLLELRSYRLQFSLELEDVLADLLEQGALDYYSLSTV